MTDLWDALVNLFWGTIGIIMLGLILMVVLAAGTALTTFFFFSVPFFILGVIGWYLFDKYCDYEEHINNTTDIEGQIINKKFED